MAADNLSALREPLPIERVEFRIQSISAKGWALVLAYKDARVDMDRLDQVAGPGMWQRQHEVINGQLFCSVGIWCESVGWVWKSDVGVESNQDSVKGQASDAFKRACFNWGIGRELYDYPLILVQLNDNEFEVFEDRGKKRGRQTFDLKLKDWNWISETETDDTGRHSITRLVAFDERGNQRFHYPRQPGGKNGAPAPAEKPQNTADDKPWFNDPDFDKYREKMIERMQGGESPAQIIKNLRDRYKVSKDMEQTIKDLHADCVPH